jgi:hypothetical protein
MLIPVGQVSPATQAANVVLPLGVGTESVQQPYPSPHTESQGHAVHDGDV